MLISVNPFRDLGIYTDEVLKTYQGKNRLEVKDRQLDDEPDMLGEGCKKGGIVELERRQFSLEVEEKPYAGWIHDNPNYVQTNRAQ